MQLSNKELADLLEQRCKIVLEILRSKLSPEFQSRSDKAIDDMLDIVVEIDYATNRHIREDRSIYAERGRFFGARR